MDDLQDYKSMLEFDLGLTLHALVEFLDNPESFETDDLSAEDILNGILDRSDQVIADWHIKYEQEFDIWCRGPHTQF